MANFKQDQQTFPQSSRAAGMAPSIDAKGYIGSSEAAGCGHQDSNIRLEEAPTPPNSESGEGRNGS